MEFTNEIYFDKNLIENNTVRISYSGKLFREFSSEVYIVLGYGPNWNDTQEHKMTLTEDCFYADINITGVETFNFCFRNNYNIWDNNNTFNYIAPIYPQNINEETNSTEDSTKQISNEYVENIVAEEEIHNEISESSSSEESVENFKNESDSDIFTELLESLLSDIETSDSSTISNDYTSYGLQNIEEIKSTSSDELNELFDQMYSDSDTSYFEAQNISDSELDILFDKVFNYEEPQSTTSELEELMNNILNAVLESDSINDDVVQELDNVMDNTQPNIYEASLDIQEEQSPIQEASVNADVQKISNIPDISEDMLPAVISTSKIDMFFDASYKFLQNVGVACKKFIKLVKLKALEYGFIKDND